MTYELTGLLYLAYDIVLGNLEKAVIVSFLT